MCCLLGLNENKFATDAANTLHGFPKKKKVPLMHQSITVPWHTYINYRISIETIPEGGHKRKDYNDNNRHEKIQLRNLRVKLAPLG